MIIEELLEKIYEHINNGEVDKAVRSCLRLSRHINDYLNTAIFLRELIGDSDHGEVAMVIFDDTSHLKAEAQKYIFEKSGEIWLKSRTLNQANNEEEKICVISVNEIPTELEQCEKSIADHTIPPTMGTFDSTAFYNERIQYKMMFRSRIQQINKIRSRILTKCNNFAIRIERQIEAQKKTRSFIEGVQNEVQNYFKAHSEDVYEKLQKANQLIDSSDSEDLSLLLTQVRRAIKAVADYFYPAQNEPIQCSDGKTRILGDDNYLNRLQEFINSQFKKSTSRDLLKSELEYFGVFAKRLNALASKGVHNEVTLAEAQQGFLGLYLLLYNICTRIEKENS
ncbi:MAG: hypothetical protein VKL41_13635 [Snowella sp.]|nr:hypothetical protein [Snowella sp.]